MAQCSGESRSSFVVCLEKLMGEVLGEECEHQVCALGIRDELPSQQNFLQNCI